MTTEGGGAIAFPVMTIALNISPIVARDFSLMIQSCGLTAAAFTIFFMSITIEWHSIVFSTIGAIFGIVFGLEVVDPLLSPAEKKMAFVSIFFSFALALYLLNSEKKRVTFDSIQNFTVIKALTLIVNGFIGGIFTGVAGSGIDVYSFSILTLLFRISEKVATPTSVVLMSANSMVGFFWRRFMDDAISQVGAIVVIRPALPLLCASAALITLSFAFYYSIGRYGKLMANRHLILQQNAISLACIS
uniref:Membrane transporter protein n=1 Tax=Ascaris lumbricoides TaxID=6252 RepID=A0A0M3HRM8_ASCLU